MMKNIYLLAMTACSCLAFSQTTLTKAANDYLTGNSVNSKNLLGTPDNSSSGANTTFDNSGLTDGTNVIAQVSTPTPADIATFPGTTIKFDDGNANLIYYKSSASQLEITGAVVSGATLNFIGDNGIFLKFPTSFGNTYTDTAKGTFTSTVASGLFKGTITTTADGTGMLLLGTKSYSNILRLKTVQTYNLYQSTDTNYLFAIGTLVSTFYTYYDNLNRYPLFTATTATISVPLLSINQTSNVAVGQASPTLATNAATVKNKVLVFPNPVIDELFFAGNFSNFDTLKVRSIDGKLLMTQPINLGKTNLSALPAGTYILQLSGKNEKDQTIQIIKK